MIYTAMAAARAAGITLKRRFGQEVQINQKTDYDIKIQADIDVQDMIYAAIQRDFPDHKLMGEEGDAGKSSGEVEWIVDPIDGTVNFVLGIPHFCISIAARRGDQMLLGVIYDPMRDEMFTAEQGKPTLLNGQVQKVSTRNELKEAVLALGFAKSKQTIDHCLELYRNYGPRVKKLRAMGSAALDLAYVATGRLDAYIEQGVNLWDVAAGGLLVQQAGGKFECERKPDGAYRICAHSGRIEFPWR